MVIMIFDTSIIGKYYTFHWLVRKQYVVDKEYDKVNMLFAFWTVSGYNLTKDFMRYFVYHQCPSAEKHTFFYLENAKNIKLY